MVNVVFSDTNSGCLHMVTDPDTGHYIKSEDIISFLWMLDIGSLREGIDSKYRKELPGKMIMQEFVLDSDEGMPEIGKRNDKSLNRLKKHLQNKEPIRIWYGDNAESLCGLFFLCTLFKDSEAPIYAMEAPKVCTHYGKMGLSNGWGCFIPEELEALLPRQRILDPKEIQAYADHWDELVQENAPLRVSLAGVPIRVDADFYDWFLEKSLPNEAIKESKVIYNVLSKYAYDANVSYLVSRVQCMIDAGRIAVLKVPNEQPMHRTIKRCQPK